MALAAHSPSSHERRELDKFIKFFITKAVQIVVQSRLGERLCNKCNILATNNDWFYLATEDNSEVLKETKKCLATVNALSTHTVNVEISLKTTDGDTMVLEVWTMAMDASHRKPVKICYTVYQRLSRLLRSLISTVRAVMAYKLSRKQSSDSFVICYRVYNGHADTTQLSTPVKSPNTYNVGSVATPFGTISLRGVCRSQLAYMPFSNSQVLNMKENYFTPEMQSATRLEGDNPEKDTEAPITDFEYVGYAPTGSPRFSAMGQDLSPKDVLQDRNRFGNSDSPDSGSAVKLRSKDRTRRLGAFAPRRDSQASIEEDVPFSLFVEIASQSDADIQFPEHSPPSSPVELVSRSLLDDPDFEMEREEDYVYVGVKTPFAPPHSDSDIGRFRKVIQSAPPLCSLGPSIHETINNLNFSELEETAREFDDFVLMLDKMQPKKAARHSWGALHHGSPV